MFSGITRDLSGIYFGDVKSKHHSYFFDETIKRAVKLIDIEPESVDILNKKRYDVEGMIYALFPELFDAQTGKHIVITDSESKKDRPPSYANRIFQNINNLELTSDDSFSWHQYFGLLALLEIDSYIIYNDWIIEEMDSPPSHIPNWDEVVINSRISTLLNAREAVCLGEVLVAQNLPTSGLIKDKISKQAQNAIQIRYQPLNAVKAQFLGFYLNYPDKSNKSEMARKFYRELAEEQQRILTPTLKTENACRTLINHLNKSLKSQPFNIYS